MKSLTILLLVLFSPDNFLRAQYTCTPDAISSVNFGCAPLEVVLCTANMNMGNANWSVGSISAPGLLTTMTLSNPGVYNVTVTVVNNTGTATCTGSAVVTITVVTGPSFGCSNTVISALGEQFNDAAFEIYPNPSTGSFEIRVQNTSTLKMILFNSLGEKVHEEYFSQYLRFTKRTELPPGIYSLCLFQEESCQAIRKIIVE